jgi:hypothetical protein
MRYSWRRFLLGRTNHWKFVELLQRTEIHYRRGISFRNPV